MIQSHNSILDFLTMRPISNSNQKPKSQSIIVTPFELNDKSTFDQELLDQEKSLDSLIEMLPVNEIVLPQLSNNVPAFLAKLWKMVDDPDTDHLIAWGDTGNSFVILNQAEFSQSLLPYYYKHSNMASFVRQLNMYGFHKVVGVDSGGLKSEKDQEMEFAHPAFLRGQEHLLGHIKRKVASANRGGMPSQAQFTPSIKTEKVTEVLNEVNQLKDKQEDMESKLDTMKKENEALWRDVITLRQKHNQQQKIVNKLIQFLVTYLHNSTRVHSNNAVKRRFQQPLAIESRGPKEARLAEPASSTSTSTATAAIGSGDQGPIIFDVTNNDELFDIDGVLDNAAKKTESPTVEVPMSPLSQAMQAVDPSLVNPAISVTNANNASTSFPTSNNSLVASKPTTNPSGRPTLQRELSKEDMDLETLFMENKLENLKDLFSGQITMDPNIISSLFNPNEPLFLSPTKENAALGGQQLSLQLENPDSHKLINVDDEQPSLFELADIDEDDQASLMPPPNADQSNVFSSLETPLVTDDTLDTNPLLAQITTSKRGRKKMT